MIPYGRQNISDEDVAAVVEVLRSDFLTQGPAVPRFEAALTAATGAEHALAVNSATSALHIACLALELGPGDLLWTVPNTFVASANVGRLCGADVDFVDVDRGNWNMSVAALQEKLQTAAAAGRLPKVVIPVHFGGESCDMAAIGELAKQYGFAVIEDASHAVGGRYREQMIGACQHSDITVFSFHPVKIVTTAEGGAALCNDTDLARRMEALRSHGVTRDAQQFQQQAHGPWYYEQVALGLNYRLTDLQAALGCQQMERLDAFVERRLALAARYDALLADLPVQVQLRSVEQRSAQHLYPVWMNPEQFDRTVVFEAMRSQGVGVNVHYIPVHTQTYYRQLGFDWGQFPEAERYYRGALSLPMFPDLTEAQQDEVVAALRRSLDQGRVAS